MGYPRVTLSSRYAVCWARAPPLSASSIQRLKARFELEYETWTQRDLSELKVVYWWADGLYVKAGIADRKSALLTIDPGRQ